MAPKFRLTTGVLEAAAFFLAAALLLFPGKAAPLGVVLLAGQAGLRRQRSGRWLPKTSISMPLVLLALTALLGCLVSPAPELSLNRLYVLILGMAAFYTILDWGRKPEQLLQAAILIILLGVGIALISLVVTDFEAGSLGKSYGLTSRFVMLIRLPGSGVPNPAEGVNPRGVAGSMAFFIPLAFSLAIFGQGWKLKVLGLLSLLPLGLPLVLSQSPQGYLSAAVGIGLVLAWRYPWTLLIQIPAAIASVIAWQNWHWWLSPAVVSRLEIGIFARVEIWRRGFLMLRDLPFSGSGLNAYPVVVEWYGPPSELPMSHAHNFFLQTANDHGMVGMIAVIVLLGMVFLSGWRAWRSAQQPVMKAACLGLAGSCAAFLGYGLADSIALGNKPALLLWGVFGLLEASQLLAPADRSVRKTSHALRYLLAGLILISLLSLPILGSSLLVNLGRVSLHQLQAQQRPIESQSLEKILDYANLAVRFWPENSRAYVLKGQSYWLGGQVSPALDSLEKAAALEGSDFMTHFQLAEMYQEQGGASQALIHWRAAGAGNWICQRGLDQLEAGNLDEAYQWLELALILGAKGCHAGIAFAQVNYELSQQLADQLDWAAAEQYADTAAQTNPTNDQYQYWLGKVYEEQGRVDDALQQYALVIQRSDSPTWLINAHHRRGGIFIDLRQFPQAVEEYRAAVEIGRQYELPDENQAFGLSLLGRALMMANDLEAARQAYLDALALNPDNQLARDGLKALDRK